MKPMLSTPITVEELRLAAPRSGDGYFELLLNWAADEIVALRHDLSRSMANHVADINANETRV